MPAELPAKQRSFLSGNKSVLLLLAVIIFIAFGNLSRADFSSLDDPFNIARNPDLNPPTVKSIGKYWVTQNVYGLYIPLTYTVWGLLAKFAYVPVPDESGVYLNPWVFHSANIVVHVCSVLVAFELLNLILRNRSAAAMCALFYGLHQIQVEAVGWAAGMKDVLGGMLSLIALWQYTTFAKNGSIRGARKHYALATLALLMAMLAKPSAMMTPVLGLTIDYWLIGRPFRSILRSLAPWFMLMIGCAINARIAQPATIVAAPPLWARPLIVGDSLTFYLRKILFPIWLAIDYGRRPAVVMARSTFYFAWIMPAIIGIAAWIGRKRSPELLAAALIFLAATAPVLGEVPFLFQLFSTTADHYLYLAMLGPALAVGWVIGRYPRRIIFAIASFVLFLLGALSIFQTQVWQNDTALFQRTLAVNPNSLMALNNLGQTYLRQGKIGLAEELLERAVKVDLNHYESTQNLANVYRARGEAAGAVEIRKHALEILLSRSTDMQGGLAELHNSLGEDLTALGHYAEARDHFRAALQLRPDFPEAAANLREVEKKPIATGTATSAPGSR